MKKLAFTTAIALALATTAYAADHGGRGPGPGSGGPGMSTMGGGGPGPGSAGPSANFRGPSNFSNNMGPSTMGPSRGPSGLYNKGPTNMNGPNRFSDRERDHDRLGDQGRDRHLYNRADRHDFDRERHEGIHDHHGVVSGNFFEHGRHFRFRRFFNGSWVFLNDWDDCTAFAWVHVAPGVWAWRPIDICIG